MDIKLAEALINKGVLPAGTEVESHYKAVGLGGVTTVAVTGYFSIVRSIVKESGKVFFILASLRDGKQTKVPAENIINVDGMDPERFASVYGIKGDGSTAKQGKRRGRKPKDRSGETKLVEADNDTIDTADVA